MKRLSILVLFAALSLSLPSSGRSADESEQSEAGESDKLETEELEGYKTDFRFMGVVGRSFNSAGRYNGHMLLKSEFSYGVWLKPWFRLGAYLDPYWQDFNHGNTHAIEGGIDASLLFLRRENWSLGLEVNEGILYSNKDFPKSNTYRFNFSNNAGVVYRGMLGKNYSLDLGYRFSHYSNAGIKKAGIKRFNPGINYHSLVVGISYYFR